jgi:hypothetical protein
MIMAMKNSEVMSQLTESRQCILKLERELEDKDEIVREKFSLLNENRELKVRVATQNERLELCQQDIDNSRVELKSLEKLITQIPVSMFEKKSSPPDCAVEKEPAVLKSVSHSVAAFLASVLTLACSVALSSGTYFLTLTFLTLSPFLAL